ncbi:MAG: zinc ribbon domain-containing protein [Phycisphaerales bacterium]|nr:zinc ribbon domain-containing protein [Phycisphaerales bacterium]
MPTYEYRCEACGHELEIFQSITAKPIKQCPNCGQKKLARLISAGGGVLFRGSGFYETDYRSESYKQAAEAEKKAVSGDSGGDKGKSDSGAKESATPAKAESAAKPAASEKKPPKGKNNDA